MERLQALHPTLVVLEATGGLEVPVASALAAAGLPVAVVNLRQVRDCAKVRGKRAKTDVRDAAVLAHFADAVRPAGRPLPDVETPAVQALVTRRGTRLLHPHTDHDMVPGLPASHRNTRCSVASSGDGGIRGLNRDQTLLRTARYDKVSNF